MIRLLGSLCLAGGGAFWGFSTAAQLSRKIRALEEITQGLHLLEQELEWSAPELHLLIRRLREESRGASRELFSAFESLVEQDHPPTIRSCWERAVDTLQELPREARWYLTGVGEVLGRFEAREQRALIRKTREQLELLARQLRETYRIQGKLLRTIGLSGGAFLAILLI